jgi:energy-coupling factor transport system ATP-binding protein
MVTHSMEEIASTVDRIVVFNQGRIAMNGTPKEVFSRGEELVNIDLSVPEVMRIAKRLNEMGLPVDSTIYTIEQLKSALLSLKGGRNNA